eukprot:5732004-Prymnesium_polylepis.1
MPHLQPCVQIGAGCRVRAAIPLQRLDEQVQREERNTDEKGHDDTSLLGVNQKDPPREHQLA